MKPTKLVLPDDMSVDVLVSNFVGTIAGWTFPERTVELSLGREKRDKDRSYSDFKAYDDGVTARLALGDAAPIFVDTSDIFLRDFKKTFPETRLALYSQCSEERIRLILDKLGIDETAFDDIFYEVIGVTEDTFDTFFPVVSPSSTQGKVERKKDFTALAEHFPGQQVAYTSHKSTEILAAIQTGLPTVQVGFDPESHGFRKEYLSDLLPL